MTPIRGLDMIVESLIENDLVHTFAESEANQTVGCIDHDNDDEPRYGQWWLTYRASIRRLLTAAVDVIDPIRP